MGTVPQLITIGIIGFASIILEKILEVTGQANYVQFVKIFGVASCSLMIVNILLQVITKLRAFG